MSTVHKDAEKPESIAAFAKGTPDVLLPRCSHVIVCDKARTLTDERREDWGAEQGGARLPVSRTARRRCGNSWSNMVRATSVMLSWVA
jgi:hypothetical protein